MMLMIKTGTNKQNTGSLPVSRVLKIGNKNLHNNNIRCLFGYDHVGIERAPHFAFGMVVEKFLKFLTR
jgi:hypothetical protein